MSQRSLQFEESMFQSNPVKLSLCITVRNERESLVPLLESLFAQSRVPEEIVIVDGGSTDGTIELLETCAAKHPDMKIIARRDVNIAKGRNVAIANAHHNYIACADGGVDYPPNWLANLVRPLESDPDVDIVSGYFEPKPETLFEESVGAMLYPNLDLVDWSRFLPSCLSVTFKKKVWEELGGFAEWLPRGVGEDTDLFLKARKAGYRFASAPDATCYWRPRRNFAELFRQYFAYSRGAFVSGTGSTFVLEAHGANPLRLVSANFGDLVQKRKPLHLCLSILVLAVVLAAKVTGGTCGLIDKRRLGPQNENTWERT
jgi:glycosyltransferase involved in cell wall biosynthesis